MRKMRKNTGLWQYLNETGVLERANKEEIKNAKSEYRKKYLRDYKKKHRQSRKEYLVSYTLKDALIIQTNATKHGISESQWIKRSAHAYGEQTFLTPAPHVLHNILQILMLCRSYITMLSQKDTQAWFKSNRNYESLEKIIHNLQTDITQTFAKPLLLQEAIQQAFKDNQAFRDWLINFLAHDS